MKATHDLRGEERLVMSDSRILGETRVELWDAKEKIKEQQTEIKRLRDALKIVAKSIYCCDGYRNVSISEEAEQAIINALKEREE